jgi:glycosyltransferase involved in cell wall biosynthesis
MKYTDNLVSILLPVCNAAEYLPSCLDSLIAQTYSQIEIIAIDDLSKDDSYRILKSYQKKDNRIRIFRNVKRYGLAVCYNRAIKKARGQFITFMNPHDVSSLHRIKRQITFLLNNTKVASVGTQYTYIDKKNKKLEKSDLPQEHEAIYHTLLPGNAMRYESVMINRYMLPKDILRFKANVYPLIYTEVFMQLFQYGKFANLAQHLYYHRQETALALAQQQARISKIWMHLKFLIKSWAVYDYRPSIRSLFFGSSTDNAPLVK